MYGRCDVRARQVGGLQPLDFLLAGHHLAGARAGGKTRDEILELLDLLLALRVLAFDPRPDLRLREHHVVVAAGVGDDRLVVDVSGVRAHRVDEMPIVRDDDECAFVAHQELAQPMDRVEVEVVGRFVQQQRLRVPEQRLRQQHPHLLSTLQLGHRPIVERFGNIETLQQDGRLARRFVAVFVADDPFELAQPHSLVVGHLGPGVEQFPLFERLPQPPVTHDHGVDDAKLVEGVLVLAQHAEFCRRDDGAPLRWKLAGQELHESGLSRRRSGRSGRIAVPRKRSW